MNPQQLTFDPPEKKEGEEIFCLTVPGRVPSWNEILAMEHWARHKFKEDLAKNFLSALRATAADSSIKTTSARSTMLTYAVTLASCLQTRREQRKLRSLRKKSALKNKSEPKSESTDFERPPF